VVEDAWLADRPPPVLEAGPITLRRTHPDDAVRLAVAVNESLEHLRPWMPWAQEPATAESMDAFLRSSDERWEAGLDFGYLLRDSTDAVVGGCGLHCRLEAGALALGYWVHVGHIGNGLATASARALTEAAFLLAGVQRVEIHCDAANVRSAAVPPRLGYELLRIDERVPAAPGEIGQLQIWATHAPGPAGGAT
jgi:RimJ/RimL family protein N-acetyltransferase